MEDFPQSGGDVDRVRGGSDEQVRDIAGDDADEFDDSDELDEDEEEEEEEGGL